jgi:UDP-N-acetylmuramyl pentapeptide phosphotransferase/UDP-N-acetylglucosamine-1-phosphate transferase
MGQAARSFIAAATGAAAARAGFDAARRLARTPAVRETPFGELRWSRTNHRGEPVTLLEGPAYAAAASAAVLAAPGVPGRLRAAGVLAAAGAGAFGVYDDLYGSADRRGIKGHLTALTQGELTTGGVKLVGIGAVGVLGGALARRGGGATEKALAAVIVAGAANAVNLLDLRPGRAIKGAAFAAAPGLLGRALRVRRGATGATAATGSVPCGAGDGVSSGRPAGNGRDMASSANVLAAAGLGAALALLPEDLAERSMLGDAGANALGALLGLAAATGARSKAALAWRAAAVTAVTLASEKVSFTKVIAACPPLNAVDLWGRRPAAAAQGQAVLGGAADEVPSAEFAAVDEVSAEMESSFVELPRTADTAASPELPSTDIPPVDDPAAQGPAAAGPETRG